MDAFIRGDASGKPARVNAFWRAVACHRFGVRELAPALGWEGWDGQTIRPPPPTHPKAAASCRTPKREQSSRAPNLGRGEVEELGQEAGHGVVQLELAAARLVHDAVGDHLLRDARHDDGKAEAGEHLVVVQVADAVAAE